MASLSLWIHAHALLMVGAWLVALFTVCLFFFGAEERDRRLEREEQHGGLGPAFDWSHEADREVAR